MSIVFTQGCSRHPHDKIRVLEISLQSVSGYLLFNSMFYFQLDFLYLVYDVIYEDDIWFNFLMFVSNLEIWIIWAFEIYLSFKIT